MTARTILSTIALASLTVALTAGPLAQARDLSFEERVEAQRAIEQVYWSHRIWPEANPGPKPPLAEVLPETALRAKVEESLEKSALLDAHWLRPLRGEDLQAEIERMARQTKSPEILSDLFAALGNDPFLIAECLARPILADREVAVRFDQEQVARSARGEPLRVYEEWAREIPVSPSVVAAEPPAAGYSLLAPQISCTYDTWSPTSLLNAPQARKGHTAVWTGSEMIVWAGQSSASAFVNSGGRYNPATDSWAATSTAAPVPTARDSHIAVWTGTTMIVWGGRPSGGGALNTGGQYNPATDTWTATSTGANLPGQRLGFAAVWNGTEMIVWGGFSGFAGSYWNTGGRYNPGTNSWAATSTGANVPVSRYEHTAVWTGSEMIVWGGANDGGAFNTGGRYNPATDSWLATSTGASVPSARILHDAVWTGSEMIIYGGGSGGGARYNPSTDSWIANAAGPSTRQAHTSVWTGSDLIAWGGVSGSTRYNNGGRFVPATNTWPTTSLTTGSGANVPTARFAHTAVYSGSTDQRMIVWGGQAGPATSDSTQTGGVYCAGICVHGSPCSDGNLCTTSDTCVSGACVGTPVVCTPVDSCHNAGSCVSGTGLCSAGSQKADGAVCDDGNACTASCPTCSQDSCQSGVCSCLPGPCTATPSFAVTTVASTDIPKTLPPGGMNLVISSVSVSIPGSPVIHDVNVQTFLRHTNASNIDMTIRSPQGSVVTLTTDNGSDFDDVFNGTVWDDSANPGGQVPYSVNHGLATDHDYANNVVATPLAPEEPLGLFVGENPNGVWQLTISDDAPNDGGTLDNWSLTLATVGVVPQETITSYSSAPGSQQIPAAGGVITATIPVAGAGTSIQRIHLLTNIMHTSCGDLDLTLTSPAGTVVTLTTDNGGTFDNAFNNTDWDDRANFGGQVPYTNNQGLVTDRSYSNGSGLFLAPEEGFAAFRGENPNGLWTLTISDDAAPDGGVFNGATMQVTTATCPASCAVTCGDGDNCTTDSCNPSLGCQHACNPGAGCVPGAITNVEVIPDGPTLTWDHATGGSTAVHDVARGQMDQLPPGTGASEVCLASGTPSTDLSVPGTPPVGTAFWYDVRGRSVCGPGPWGAQSDGTPHAITVCP